MLFTIGTIGSYVSTLCLILSVLLLLINSKALSPVLRKLSYYLCWNLVIELGAYLMIKIGVNNLPLLHIYTFGELLLWAVFYLEVLKLTSRQRTSLLTMVAVAALLIVLNSIFLQNIYGFNSYAKTLVNVILIGLSILLLYQLLHSENEAGHRALGLINSSVLFYYSGSLLIFMFSDYFFRNAGVPSGFWVFNVLINLVFQVLILRAIWIALDNKKSLFLLR